jgi:hypothetical protein
MSKKANTKKVENSPIENFSDRESNFGRVFKVAGPRIRLFINYSYRC